MLGSAVGIALVHWLRIAIAQAQAERARAEALAEQREMLIEADPNGIVVVDRAGRIRTLNNRLAELFGYHRDELVGQSGRVVPDRFRRNHPSLRDGFSAQPSKRLMGAGRDLYGLRKNGTEFPVEIGLSSFTSGGHQHVTGNRD